MLAGALRYLPALLVPVAMAWVLAPAGMAPSPAVAVLTVGLVAGLCIAARVGPSRWDDPRAWLAALIVWCCLDAALRPVAVTDAAACVAVGAVALGLAWVCVAPRVAAWGRMAVVAAGSGAAGWLIAERLLMAGRPAGPFGNPNFAATVVLLALALVPLVRLPGSVRAVVLAVTAGGVVASGSRAALLGLVAVAFVWVLAAGRGARVRLAAGVLVIAAGLGLAARVLADRDPLRYERVRIWAVALRVARAELPLGCGPGGYVDAAVAHNFPRDGEYARFARIPDLAESDFLQAVATLGLPGALLLVGLSASIVRRMSTGSRWGWGVLAALVVTSALSSQLMVPAVVWTATVAVGSVLPRAHGRQGGPAFARVVIVAALAVAAVSVLALPNWGAGEPPEVLIDRADTILYGRPRNDNALADGEALAWWGCSARPLYGRGWRVLGSVRLTRASLRKEADLAWAAAEAFASARRADPQDAFAALGQGQALRLVNDSAGAWQALRAAVALEPNFVAAWLEQSVLHLSAGQIGAAREALGRAEAAARRARGVAFVSDYERTLAWANPAILARLQAATGGVP